MKTESNISTDFYETICNFLVPFHTNLVFDGWNFAEFYLIYCLERNITIPLLNQQFFDDCLKEVSGGFLRGQCTNNQWKIVFNQFVEHSHPNYAEKLRNRNKNLRRGIGTLVESISAEMSTRTIQMLKLFPNRYHKWIKMKYFEEKESLNIEDKFLFIAFLRLVVLLLWRSWQLWGLMQP